MSSKETRRSRAQKVASKDEYLFSLSSATSDVWQYVQQADAQEAEYSQGPTGKRVRTGSSCLVRALPLATLLQTASACLAHGRVTVSVLPVLTMKLCSYAVPRPAFLRFVVDA